MKKLFVSVLSFLFLTFNPALADGKANVKIGTAQVLANSDVEGHIVTVSKSGTSLFISVTASKIVFAKKPTLDVVSGTMTFAIPEEDFINGETYNLEPRTPGQVNIFIAASHLKKGKGTGIASNLDSIASGVLKVTSYDASTGSLKATLTATMAPSILSVIKGSSSKEKVNDEPVPMLIEMDVILDHE